jgi:hypothetical protein
MAASATFYAGAGVNAFVVSMTASNTLAILLLLGVVARAFATFGNSASAGGLKISSGIIVSSSSGFLTAFSLASATFSGISIVSVVGTFGKSICLSQQWKMFLRQILALRLFQYILADGSKL